MSVVTADVIGLGLVRDPKYSDGSHFCFTGLGGPVPFTQCNFPYVQTFTDGDEEKRLKLFRCSARLANQGCQMVNEGLKWA